MDRCTARRRHLIAGSRSRRACDDPLGRESHAGMLEFLTLPWLCPVRPSFRSPQESLVTASASTSHPAPVSLVIASRESRLALWQAEHIRSRLAACYPEAQVAILGMTTRGDQILDRPLAAIGGKGLFIKELEVAMAEGRADLAVHSLKDVPMDMPDGFVLAAIPARETPFDAFVSPRYASLAELPPGAVVGTSSLRRAALLRARFPQLRIESLRGNVDTRLRKLREGVYDAIVLASAGLNRLELTAPCMHSLDPQVFLPAVGQGALGIECREDDYDLFALLAQLEDTPTRVCVEAERGFLAGLEGGCQVPIAGHARLLDDDTLCLEGLVAEVDGSRILRAQKQGHTSQARQWGLELASEILDQGGRAILEKLYRQS